jgi:hypothetical protein
MAGWLGGWGAAGVALIRLAELLTGVEMEGWSQNPTHLAFKHQNINRAIMHFKAHNINIPPMPAHGKAASV